MSRITKENKMSDQGKVKINGEEALALFIAKMVENSSALFDVAPADEDGNYVVTFNGGY
jgi:hypothetical protein